MPILRTRFARDIVAEFLPPAKPSRRVIVLFSGMPSVPKNIELMQFLARRGFWVFAPRYRGSWESGGQFLRRSPEQDVYDVIDQIPRWFVDAWSGKRYTVRPSNLYLIGGSFGGPAVILGSRDKRVTKALALCPVVDWQVASPEEESLPKLLNFIRQGFGQAYRVTDKDWKKLESGRFYNPMCEAASINGKKLMIMHARNDGIVPWRSVASFAKQTGARLELLSSGGHLKRAIIMEPQHWRRIQKFFKE